MGYLNQVSLCCLRVRRVHQLMREKSSHACVGYCHYLPETCVAQGIASLTSLAGAKVITHTARVSRPAARKNTDTTLEWPLGGRSAAHRQHRVQSTGNRSDA